MAEVRQSLISERVAAQRAKLRKQKRTYAGLRFIDTTSEQYPFPRGSRDTKTALANLDKQDSVKFRVFTNPNDEVVVQQTEWTPFFHLV